MPAFAAKWKNFFEAGRKLPPAYLLSGPEGSGRHSVADEIVRTLLKKTEGHPDLLTVAPEKTSIKIESIRQILHRLSLKPLEADRIVVVIDEADAMTEGAANALLKTLEEPPAYVLFLLISAKPEKLPATIRSRCQHIRFQIGDDVLRDQLASLYEAWREDLKPILQGTRPSFVQAARVAEGVAAEPERFPSLFNFLRAYWRDLAAWKTMSQSPSLLLPAAQELLHRKAAARTPESLFTDMDLILETERAIEGNVNKMLALERLFAKLIQ